ncbi:hypothetical protein AB0O34_22275 [Sphaerisporangium sp. NPDC088356]|jgi:hypothetical protein|uniref:hypothetical protein n=1 Tax=Sphaerisporangium sp. NPDC088356 TaxID=3154871 RepID=UPI003421D9B3
MTITELNSAYGKHWLISEAMGGGWYAVRRHSLSTRALERGLSNVRCGNTLEELGRYLSSETHLEQRRWVSLEAS